jgi:hypothetical protein
LSIGLVLHPGVSAFAQENQSIKHADHKNNASHKNKKHSKKKTTKKNKKSLHKKNHAHVATKKTYRPNITDVPEEEQPITLVSSIEKRLVSFVHDSVAKLRYSAYKLGGSHFDPQRGIYIVDCSGYVDHALSVVYPKAYLSLVDSTGTEKPNTMQYYDFFKGLSDGNEDANQHWSKVEDIEKLRPGDILVFRYKNRHGEMTGGHVMFVMEKPVRDQDAYLVSVADSAPVGHSDDTRSPHVSGIGIGTILLKVNPKTGEPSAYAWNLNAHWVHNVNFAMARPIEQNDNA